MAKYNIEITLADNIVNKIIEAEDELQAMDKIYEYYKNKNIKVYDIKVV